MKKIKLLSVSLIIIFFSSCKENSKSSNDSSNISSNIKTGVTSTPPKKTDKGDLVRSYAYKLSFKPLIDQTKNLSEISLKVFDNNKKETKDYSIENFTFDRSGYAIFLTEYNIKDKDMLDFNDQAYTLTIKTSDGKSVSYDGTFTDDLNDSN
jgi:hypothetical protein